MCQNFIEPMIMTVIQYPKNLKECVGEGDKPSRHCNVIDPCSSYKKECSPPHIHIPKIL